MTDLLELLQSTDTPLWIALLSPSIVITGVIYTIRRTDRREIESWRRDKILGFTTTIIEESNARMDAVRENRKAISTSERAAERTLSNTSHTDAMRVAHDKLKILCNMQLTVAVNDLIYYQELFYSEITSIKGADSSSRIEYRISQLDHGTYFRHTRLNRQLELNLGLKRPWYIRLRRSVLARLSYPNREKALKILTWYRKKTNSFYRETLSGS